MTYPVTLTSRHTLPILVPIGVIFLPVIVIVCINSSPMMIDVFISIHIHQQAEQRVHNQHGGKHYHGVRAGSDILIPRMHSLLLLAGR